ncbi:GNAT family N-acetyltransferase [Halolamina sp.]|uniref:GNAT family N-acetyltransferase n=1 Tax=Halolamina sp. TaxID=1940283 RepID=UPI000223BD80|nr:GCN5-related N-acetyltransferase [halophilic archaeon DL31]
MVIRDATPGDRPAIERLQQLLPEPAPELLEPAAGGELLVTTAQTESGNETVVGYILWFPSDPVYVAEIVVHPEFRANGRGSRLFRALFDRLSDGTAVDLRVAAANAEARRLYRHLGFQQEESLQGAYESGLGYRMRYVVGESDAAKTDGESGAGS